MTAVGSVLVVGAGLAGTAVAIRLAAAGVAVDLVEAKADVTAVGSGITLQGNALRELRHLGVWERAAARGWPAETTILRAPDAHGTVLVEVHDAKAGGPDLPAVLGMPRTDLARVLTTRAVAVGAKLRMGTAPVAFDQDAGGVDVSFADGSTGRYDLVVGADGVRSWTRHALGIELVTRPLGMGIWRVFGPRPASVTATSLYYGGPSYIAGFCPTGPDSLYAYVVEEAQDRSALTPAEQLETLRALAAPYHGPWDEIRDGLVDPTRVNYTWFETHVLPAPWNRGRVVLVGDAAHTCPPTLAQGGAQALEDAGVLAELLIAANSVDDDLWDAFTARRHARAAAVVAASNQLCRWLLDREQGDVAGLMRSTMALVSQPA